MHGAASGKVGSLLPSGAMQHLVLRLGARLQGRPKADIHKNTKCYIAAFRIADIAFMSPQKALAKDTRLYVSPNILDRSLATQ